MKLDDFLNHVFRGLPGPDEIVITASGPDFQSYQWFPGEAVPPESLYYCISTVRDDPEPRRRTEDLMKTYVVVLDDVKAGGISKYGVKIKLSPSNILETSPDNFQWGFLFTEGVDPAKARALIEGIAAAGLTDKGAKRADRIMRVPGSINEKPGKAASSLGWSRPTGSAPGPCRSSPWRSTWCRPRSRPNWTGRRPSRTARSPPC